jgi:hypothetical protein
MHRHAYGRIGSLSVQLGVLASYRVRGRESTAITDQKATADAGRALTTKADPNGTRRGPIPADALVAQHQVSDCLRQPRRILQAQGRSGRAM